MSIVQEGEKIIPVTTGPEGTTLLVKESSFPQVIQDLKNAGRLDATPTPPLQPSGQGSSEGTK